MIARAMMERIVRPVAPENVDYYNSLQVIDSGRHVFSATGDFKIVEEMLAKDPAMRDPARRRIEVVRGAELVVRDEVADEPTTSAPSTRRQLSALLAGAVARARRWVSSRRHSRRR